MKSSPIVQNSSEDDQLPPGIPTTPELLRRLPLRVYVKDAQGRFLFANAETIRAHRLQGNPKAILGTHDRDYFKQEHVAESGEDEDSILTTGEPRLAKMETEVWRDGRISWVITSKYPAMDPHGEIVGTVGFTHEINELEQLRLAAQNTQDGLWHRNIITGQLWVSPRYLEMLNLTHRDSQNTSAWFPGHSYQWFLNHVADEDRERVHLAIDDRLKGGATDFEYQFRMRKERGGYCQILSRGKITRDRKGEPLFVTGVHTDITDASAAELLDFIQEIDPNLIFLKDAAGRFVRVSKALATLYGTTVDEAVGKTDFDFSATRDEQEHFRKDDQWVIEHNTALPNIRELIRDAQERSHILLTTKVPIQFRGAPHVLGVSADITALEEERERLRTFMDALPFAVYEKDSQYKFVRANRALVKFAGKKSAEEIINRLDTDLFPAEYAAQARRSDETVLMHGKPVYNETPLQTDEGVVIRVTRKVPLKDAGQQIIGIVGISYDMTAEEQRKRDESRMRGMEDLLRAVCHETVGSLLERVITDVQSRFNLPVSSQNLHDWLNSLEFIQDFIDNVQLYMQPGDLSINKRELQAVSLRESAEYANQLANGLLQSPHCELEIPPDLEMSADKSLLRRLLFNLIYNAKKYASKTNVPVYLRARRTTSGLRPTGFVEIDVCNESERLPEDVESRLGFVKGLHFDPTENGIKRRVTGTGFGLYLCRMIAKAHGGDMHRPEYRDGQYTFRFTLKERAG